MNIKNQTIFGKESEYLSMTDNDDIGINGFLSSPTI